MFNFIGNTIYSVLYGIYSVVITLFTGKLCKISIFHSYHNLHNANPFCLCDDEFIKTTNPKNVSVSCEYLIISSFINATADNSSEVNKMYSKLDKYVKDLKCINFKED